MVSVLSVRNRPATVFQVFEAAEFTESLKTALLFITSR